LTRSFPFALLAAYVILFVVAGIAPHDRAVWWAETIPIVALAGSLVVLYARGARLSNLGYALASVLLFLHTIGGHYTFERVPFGWVTQTFGFQRNHFDRIAHFSVGGFVCLRARTGSRTKIRNFPPSCFHSVLALSTSPRRKVISQKLSIGAQLV
jgi:putative membrane protein